jgi:hypothetical protein
MNSVVKVEVAKEQKKLGKKGCLCSAPQEKWKEKNISF